MRVVRFNKIHSICWFKVNFPKSDATGPRSAVGSASDSRARSTGFDIRIGHILSFLLPLIQERRLSVTSASK